MANFAKEINESYFAERSVVNPVTGCHEWVSPVLQSGYGVLKHRQKQWKAHRFLWTFRNGPIPDGMLVCHKCDNRRCINPDHLFLGTTQDNVDDKMKKGRFKLLRGEQIGTSKLKPQDVIAIINDSRPQAKIAAAYGIAQSNVSMIKQRKAWQGVVV
jgi:hypothetical protein